MPEAHIDDDQPRAALAAALGVPTASDEELRDVLAGWAARLIDGGRPDPLVAHLDAILAVDRTSTPELALLAAMLVGPARREAALADALLGEAEVAYAEAGDRDGEGWVAHVRGSIALERGRLLDAGRWWTHAAELLGSATTVQARALAQLAQAGLRRTGDVAEAIRVAGEALAMARAEADAGAEALALTLLGWCHLATGELTAADAELVRAEAAYGAVADVGSRHEWPMVAAGRGWVAALRGRTDESAELLDHAVARSVRLSSRWHLGVALAVRAEALGTVDAERAAVDAARAAELFEEVGERWWQKASTRAAAMADVRRGAGSAEAMRVLADAARTERSPLERGRTLLALGEAHLLLGDVDAAADALDEACLAFEAAGARFLLGQALVMLCAARPDDAASFRLRARALSDGDVAWQRLLHPWGRFAVRCLGLPAVFVDGRKVAFPTVHSQVLVHGLALAGPEGVRWDEAAERLWPGVPAGRARPRLRTALWQARRALGAESWRLQRVGEDLVLDLEGARVDLHDAIALADHVVAAPAGSQPLAVRVREALAQPLLPAWRFEPWVIEHDLLRQATLERVERAIAAARAARAGTSGESGEPPADGRGDRRAQV